MAQADRVLSTPRTNTPTSHDRLESAPGAVQLSPRALIRTSPPAACQALPVDSETLPGSRIKSDRAAMNRRAVMNMVVGAALTGTAIPAVAAGPADPIFAAIERHRRAYKELNDNLGEDDIEAAVPEERRRSNIVAAIFGEPDWRVEGDDPRWIAHIETACRTHAENDDSAIALVSCERAYRSRCSCTT
jgi:hypothetical protein